MTDRRTVPGTRTSALRPVAIIGAGVAGLTLAIRLRQNGHAVAVFEARGREGLSEGAFLTLAPNGINALRALGLADRISALGIPTRGFEIMNGRGKRLARLDETIPMLAAGALSVTLRRCDLLKALCCEAEALGAEVCFDHALSGLERQPGGVALHFGNGATVKASWVAGCDGVWSRTRRLAFPDAPEPVYTGLTGTGGFVDLQSVPETGGFMRMVFGETAFFGYIKDGAGPVFWFDSFPLDEDAALAKPDARELAMLGRRLHAGDPEPVRAITQAVEAIPRAYPVFDMQHLPRWHDGPVALLGDAAHAVSPHAGQGAAMAIEDAVVLAACVSARASAEQAFSAFQALRQERVERIVRVSRRIGSQKRASGRLALFLRDLVLPWAIPISARASRAVHRYRADLDPLERPSL
jgi:2-polyprenyl-6-methoxyphenol hydroxylase-like FAD-dependent oxidoreductase